MNPSVSIRAASTLGLALALASPGCGRPRFYTGETTSGGEVVVFTPSPAVVVLVNATDLDTLRIAIARALAERGYVIEGEEGPRMTVRLAHGRTTLRFTLDYSLTQLSLTYLDSFHLAVEDNLSSRQYDRWVRELSESIQAEIDRPAREAAELAAQQAREAEARARAAAAPPPTTIVVVTAPSPAASVAGDLVVNGSFEQQPLAPGGFQTLASTPGWLTTRGPGLELQHGVAGAAADGAQHVELDSDANSAIAQDVSTLPGNFYELSFSYSPRPGAGAHSNGVEIWFAGRRIATAQAAGDGLPDTRWVRAHVLVQAQATVSRIELRAAGTEDTVGGYLDAISLVPAELPSIPPPVVVPATTVPVVVNGSFEEPGVQDGSFRIQWSIPGWGMMRGRGVEVQHGAAGAAFEGGQLLELDADDPVAIGQSVATTAGGLYELGLAYSPRPGCGDNRLQVGLSGQRVVRLEASGDGHAETAWVAFTFSVRAPAEQTNLELEDQSVSDGLGGYLDAITLRPATL